MCSGNFIIITSTTCCTLALTWGGVTAAWTSLQVLVPLWCGLLGLAFFLLYEATVAVDPLVRVFPPLPPYLPAC
jgi:hypothetical protein